MSSNNLVVLAFCLASVASSVACESMQNAMSSPVEAVVVVPEAKGGNTQFLVQSSGNGSCQQGVRELRNQQWDKALTAFQQALLDNPDDHHAHFGMGLACEELGKLDQALEHFQAANRIPRQPIGMYATSVERVRAKLGK
jgi:tetratricopeptide (TPR) repeat protein